MNPLPQAFKDNILFLLPQEAGYFFDALAQAPQTSIRYHKGTTHTNFPDATQVPWCSEGFLLKERPRFISDPAFHGGRYYVQESSSMFLSHVVKSLYTQSAEAVMALDLCAAPGGKSTLLLDALPDNSLLVCNEMIKSRVPVLQENIIKWGKAGVVISNNDPAQFENSGLQFDFILVDAPCSGEGLWRRDPQAMNEWSPENVSLCTGRQWRILKQILPCLKPGGTLVYSTCTFNQSENEDQVMRLINEEGLLPQPISISPDWPIANQSDFMFRFLPHKVPGEGLFMAVLRKPEETDSVKPSRRFAPIAWLSRKESAGLAAFIQEPASFSLYKQQEEIYMFPDAWRSTLELLKNSLYLKQAGTSLGTLDKKNQLIPSHSLALSVHAQAAVWNKLKVDAEQALLYLRKIDFKTSQPMTQGWSLVEYENIPLGWAKILPNRINNYYPPEYRILKEL